MDLFQTMQICSFKSQFGIKSETENTVKIIINFYY